MFALFVSLFAGLGVLVSTWGGFEFLLSNIVVEIPGLGMPLMTIFFWLLVACMFPRVADSYLVRALPSRVGSWLMLLRDKLKARPAGLGIVRGGAMGACYLGAHTAVLGALGAGRLAGPSVVWLQVAGQFDDFLILYALSSSVLTTMAAAWLMVGLPAAFASRASGRGWVLVGVPAGLWVASASSLTGASAFPLLPAILFAGIQGLFFSWVLYRYDFLTVLAAMFTVETWLVIYPVFVILSPIELPVSSLGLLPWFLLLLLGLVLYLRLQLEAAWRRMTAVFE